ncbi:hypothetical protein [Flagellimonas pelagia]|uniref:CdiI immunity protein domain-containing protein n=1 Tax=Flagellimonas pelagia TaxID=2306998 RepID=A0A3A1NFR6_9FLAO|nr:hypothetical protein [Allomuricauda maritima]RIV42064.1 hypothetical protein D2V05_18375 [Allomuricauda maritima]TXJ90949.1 hypothetical protein FQ017_18215 [Allomuricauda maritima]
MNNTIDYLKSMLHCFIDEFYSEGVKNVRKDLNQNQSYKDNWSEIVRIVLNKELKDGQALDLIHNTANLPLYENSDEEAYRWLSLMLINVSGSDDDLILDYKDVFKPNEG